MLALERGVGWKGFPSIVFGHTKPILRNATQTPENRGFDEKKSRFLPTIFGEDLGLSDLLPFTRAMRITVFPLDVRYDFLNTNCQDICSIVYYCEYAAIIPG
jgi:hypothetical protein